MCCWVEIINFIICVLLQQVVENMARNAQGNSERRYPKVLQITNEQGKKTL